MKRSEAIRRIRKMIDRHERGETIYCLDAWLVAASDLLNAEDGHAGIAPQPVEPSANAEQLPVITFRPWEPKTLADLPDECAAITPGGSVVAKHNGNPVCLWASHNGYPWGDIDEGAGTIRITRVLGFPEFKQGSSDETK